MSLDQPGHSGLESLMGDLSSGQNRVRILGGPHLPTWGLVSGEGMSEAP